jgi:hypothetical protein
LGHNIGFKRRKFKEFRGFLEKSVFNSSFSDYEITEKSFVVNMTFNFNQNFIMNTQKSKKKRQPAQPKRCPCGQMKEIHYGYS